MVVKIEDLIAPEKYNLVSEFEKYADDPGRLALKWESDTGETKQITYAELIKNANKIGNIFSKYGLKKRGCRVGHRSPFD